MGEKKRDYSTIVATRYDRDVTDLHFLDNRNVDHGSIRDPALQYQRSSLSSSSPPEHCAGRKYPPTRPAIQSSDQLRLQIERRRANDFNFKGYNLIILTDSKPDEESKTEMKSPTKKTQELTVRVQTNSEKDRVGGEST